MGNSPAPILILILLGGLILAVGTDLPVEPVIIGNTPQFLIDDYLVDNRFALKYAQESPEMVLRKFHPPRKHPGNPLLRWSGTVAPEKPRGGPSYVSVQRNPGSGLFRMWYQDNIPRPDSKPGTALYSTAIGYADSRDGIEWRQPRLGLIEVNGSRENNLVWRGLESDRAAAPQILDIPPEFRRGFRYVMLYNGRGGMHLMGSHDGIHWDRPSHTTIATMHSDTSNCIVYDPRSGEFSLFCRAKHIYRTRRGEVLDVGASRRVALMKSRELWTQWRDEPRNILIPDELDNLESFNFFYGMTASYHAGLYWGFAQSFKWNTDIHVELAWSRSGTGFERFPTRPKLIPRGPEAAWDSGLIFAGPGWIEVGDEWWIDYTGWDGPHGRRENEERGRWRQGAIGLAKVRKEGFISLRGPRHGGVVVTRKLLWPGGELRLNADAHSGELKVRVSDARRQVLPGLDYSDCVPFTGDSVSHQMQWKDRQLSLLAGKVIRLEFYLQNADLYTFRAEGSD